MTPTPVTGTPRLALIAAGVSVVLWASAYVGIRDVADTFSPGAIALGRLFVGSLALGLPLLTRGWVHVRRRDFGFIVAAGLLWFGAYNIALNEAERHVDAGTASMLVNTGPIFLGIFAGVFLREGLPARLLVGLAVAFDGSVVVGFALPSDAAGSNNSIVGIALCIASAIRGLRLPGRCTRTPSGSSARSPARCTTEPARTSRAPSSCPPTSRRSR